MKRTIFQISGLLILCSILFACSSEYRVATDYVEKLSVVNNGQDEQIYVVLPKEVIHTNRTISQMSDFFDLDNAKQDSIIKATTQFLDKVNDSILLAQFNRQFLYNLSRLKIPVTVCDSPLQFPLNISSKTTTINVVQMELEEFSTTGELVYSNNDYKEKYTRTVPLKGVSLNVWFSYNERDTLTKKVYYRNIEITDDLEGDIYPESNGKAKAKYRIEKLNLNDVYYTPYALGKLTATLFIEKLINDYVTSVLGHNSSYYYFYDPSREKITGSIYKSNLNLDYLLQEVK